MVLILKKEGNNLTVKDGSTIYQVSVEAANPEVKELLQEEEAEVKQAQKKPKKKKTTTKKKQASKTEETKKVEEDAIK